MSGSIPIKDSNIHPDVTDGDALVPMVKRKQGHKAQGMKPHMRLDKKPAHIKDMGSLKK